MTYDDSMNLRNILWLAPLPSNSSKAWVAPGTNNNHFQFYTDAIYVAYSEILWSLSSSCIPPIDCSDTNRCAKPQQAKLVLVKQ